MGENRTRTIVVPPVQQTATLVVTGHTPATYTNYYDDRTGHSIMNDVVTSEYQKKSHQGAIINNAMDIDYEECDYKPLIYDQYGYEYTQLNPVESDYYNGHYYNSDGVPFMSAPDYSSECQSMTTRAVQEAWAKVTTTDWASLVAIGEAGQTVKGTADILKRLGRIIWLLHNNKYGLLGKELHPDELLDRWMEVRYGIRPLVFELQDITKMLSSNKKVGDRQTFRSHSKRTWDDDASELVKVGGKRVGFNCNQHTTTEFEIRAGVLTQLEQYGLLQMCGITDIVPAIVDLTTLSFVMDWIFNVSSTIAAFAPDSGIKTLGSWTTATTTVTSTAQVSGITWRDTNYPPTFGNIRSDPRKRVRKTVIRIPNPPRSVIPSFKLRMDMYKLVDLVAITKNLWDTFRGSKGKFFPK